MSFASATVNKVDECVDVSDTLAGSLVPGCAGVGTLPKTFAYPGTIRPYAEPGTYTVTNTASFVANDTGTTGSDSWTVTVTVLPKSLVTSSSLCTFGGQFNLIYTQDPTNTAAYKMTASNPGQFYYNVFTTVGSGGSVNVTLPYPFVTQGATPIHVYSGVTITSNGNGGYCITPGTESTIASRR